MQLYKTKQGETLYPVCDWEKNQHKLYNAHDRIMLSVYDNEADYDDVDRIEKAMSAFDRYVINGMVYATEEDKNLILDYVWAYDMRI